MTEVAKHLFNAWSVKRSEVANGGRCCYSGVTLPTCKDCTAPANPSEFHGGHDCPEMAEYVCTIPEQGRYFFMCGGMTKLPMGFCKAHAIIHAKSVHNNWSTKLDQRLKLFAIVVDG